MKLCKSGESGRASAGCSAYQQEASGVSTFSTLKEAPANNKRYSSLSRQNRDYYLFVLGVLRQRVVFLATSLCVSMALRRYCECAGGCMRMLSPLCIVHIRRAVCSESCSPPMCADDEERCLTFCWSINTLAASQNGTCLSHLKRAPCHAFLSIYPLRDSWENLKEGPCSPKTFESLG